MTRHVLDSLMSLPMVIAAFLLAAGSAGGVPLVPAMGATVRMATGNGGLQGGERS